MDRQVEQQRILRAVADARHQHGSVLLLTGEAGVGKTHLCADLMARQRRARALVLEGAPGAEEPQPALAAVADSLRCAEADVRAAVWRMLSARAPRLAAVLPELAGNGEPAAAEEPLLFRDLVDAVAEAAGRAPVIWLLDDMQRAEQATWHFLWYLCRHVAGRRFLIMASCRDDDLVSPQGGRPSMLALTCDLGAHEVHLDRLGRADTWQLVSSRPGVDLPSRTVARIVERSAGNPRVAIELVEAAVAGSVDRVPPSILHTVALRAATLTPAAGELLEALAIVEPGPELQVVLALPRATDTSLAQLCKAGLIDVASDRERPVVRFRHPLYRDAAYEMTSLPRRRLLHTQIANVLARTYDRRDVTSVLVTARHRELGGDPSRAIQHLGRAARTLRAAGETRAAGDLFLATLQTLDRSPGLAGSRSRVVLSAMQELSLAGRWIELLPIVQRLWRASSRALRGEKGELPAVLGMSLLIAGRIEEATTLLTTQASRLERTGQSRAAPWLLTAASAACLLRGQLAKARHLCELTLQTDQPGVRGLARCLAVAVQFLSDRDRRAAADAYGALADCMRADGLAELAALAGWNRARMTIRMEDALRVEAMGERSGQLITALSRLLTCTIHLLEGRESRAATALDRARSTLGDAVPLLMPLVDGLQAHIDLHLGELERARSRLEPWAGDGREMWSLARTVIRGAQGWLCWETDSLKSAVERWAECADDCADGGYGLIESGPLHLPLHVDALVRLGRADEARQTVRAAQADCEPDRFSRASLAAARFRLSPSPELWKEARDLAAAAPWPLVEAQLGCWCAEHLGNRSAGEAAVRLASAIGARRSAERTTRALATRAITESAGGKRGSASPLSLRELQVAALVADGLSNAAIAGRLNVSVATVSTHVKNILAKLRFRSRAQVAAWVSEQRVQSWEIDVLLRLGRKVMS